MPGTGAQAMARSTAARPAQHQLLPRCLHRTPRTQPFGTDFTQAIPRPVIRRQLPDPAPSRSRSQTPRCRDRVPLHPAHVEFQPAAPLSCPLRRSRWRTIGRSSALDPHQPSAVPAACSRPAHRLPHEIPRRPLPAPSQGPAQPERSSRSVP